MLASVGYGGAETLRQGGSDAAGSLPFYTRQAISVQPEEIVDTYLNAVARHDYEGARVYLADTGFSYESPIARFDSADAFMEYSAMNMSIFQRFERVKTFVDGPDVCSFLIVHIQISDKAQVKMVYWARVEDGRIRRMEVLFDASIYQTLFLSADDGQG
jgi:hypothetical protein